MQKEVRIFGADFETETVKIKDVRREIGEFKFKDVDILLNRSYPKLTGDSYMTHVSFSGVSWLEEGEIKRKMFNSVVDMIDHLLGLGVETHVWFFNMSNFDGKFILNVLLGQGYRVLPTEERERTKAIVKYVKRKKNTVVIEYKDNLMLKALKEANEGRKKEIAIEHGYKQAKGIDIVYIKASDKMLIDAMSVKQVKDALARAEKALCLETTCTNGMHILHQIKFKNITFKALELNLQKNTLKEHGRAFGCRVEKGDYDFDKHIPYEYPTEFFKYFDKDLLLTLEVLNKAIEVHGEKSTLSSNAFERFLNINFAEAVEQYNAKNPKKKTTTRKMFKLIFPQNTEQMICYSRYSGAGICYLTRRFESLLIDGLCKGDLVSSYPAVMLNKPLPKGEGVILDHTKFKSIKRLKQLLNNGVTNVSKLYLIGFRCKSCKWHGGNRIPILRVGKQNVKMGIPSTEYVRELDKPFEYYTNSVVMDYILQYYAFEGFEVTELIRFATGGEKYTGKYVEKYSGDKTENKALSVAFLRGRDVEDLSEAEREIYNVYVIKTNTAKLFLNSLSGKFYQTIVGESIPHIDEETGSLKYKDIMHTEVVNEGIYAPLSIFIWAWGQKALLDLVEQAPDHFVYCDTDSAFFDVPTFKELSAKTGLVLDEGKQLGQWEIEGENLQAKILGPKSYALKSGDKISVKGAGIPKETMKEIESIIKRDGFDAYNTNLTIVNGCKKSKNVLGGTMIYTSNMTIKRNSFR